jgi:hypothetical protein
VIMAYQSGLVGLEPVSGNGRGRGPRRGFAGAEP